MVRKRRGRKSKPLSEISVKTLSLRATAELIEAISVKMVYYNYYLDKGLDYKVDRSLS